jgi:hypothetical protein
MADGDGDGDGQRSWQLRWPTVMEMAMANSKGNGDGDGNGNDWWRCNRDSGSNDQWQPQWQWPTATATSDGNGNGNEVGNDNRDGDGNHNGVGHGKGNNDKVRVASSCVGNMQRYGRSNTLPPPPWTQRRVHSPALCHGGDTAKSVSSLLRGRVPPGSSPWILFLFIIYNYCSVYWTTLCLPPHIIQALKNPVSPLMLYLLHFSKNPISLLTIYPGSYCTFCQGKPRQGLQWLWPYFFVLMWNDKSLSNLLYFPNFCSVIDGQHLCHLKSHCRDGWDIQGQSLSNGFNAFSCATLSPGLGARICLATF